MAALPLFSPRFCAPAASISPLARTETALREAGLAGRFWRGDTLSSSPQPSTPSGFRELDEQLPGGGWPARCLIELLLQKPGIGEIRFLAGTLAALTRSGRQIVLLAPPHVPDPAGWAQWGIDMRQVLMVRAERPADRLWAIEQSLKSAAFGALLAWLPEEKTLARHDALRRLQLAAAGADGPAFLFRPAAAQHHASPAALRLALSPGRPMKERRTLAVRLLKRRGPVLAAPIVLALPEVRPALRSFNLSIVASTPASSMAASVPSTPHALVRDSLPDPGARLHPAPLA